jgi:hypothetical protein
VPNGTATSEGRTHRVFNGPESIGLLMRFAAVVNILRYEFGDAATVDPRKSLSADLQRKLTTARAMMKI